LLLDQVLVSYLVHLTGGASSGATSFYGVTCLAGGLLLGVPGAVASALAGGVLYALTVLLGEASSLPALGSALDASPMRAASTTFYLVVNVLVLALVALLVSYLLERLERASGELAVERRRAEQAERMAALGQLAAGLAHEIRNPLSSIAASVQILSDGLTSDEDRELCAIMLRESARLNELVTDMVDLARPRQPLLAPVNVARLVGEVISLAQRSGRANHDVRVVQRAPAAVWVRADAGQLRQLVWNLLRNAIQASGAGAEVRVSLDVGERVLLRVEDDGVGIDSASRERIFDAFFTTRSQGSGVGLAVVKRIADDHGFAVSVLSEAGQGARFEVDLGRPLEPPAAETARDGTVS
jgi:signal transduction histidine kinase